MRHSMVLLVLLAACSAPQEKAARPERRAGTTAPARPPAVKAGAETPIDAPATVVRACPDGSAEHTSLQAAIDAAPDGALVLACGATFTESVTVEGRSLTLRGEPGAVLDAGSGGTTLVVRSGEAPAKVRVEGLEITGGDARRGGGVACREAELAMRNVVVRGNRANQGGGMAADDCAIDLVEVEVSGNLAHGEGGGGHLLGGRVTVERSTIAANTGADGGGLLIRGAEGHVRDSVFEDNVGHVGGGVWFDGGFLFAGNIVRRNEALYTGGGFAGDLTTGEIVDNEVYENLAHVDGGGGFTRYGGGRIAGNVFRDNVSDDDAGALRMLYGAALIEGNQFIGNTAAGAGGAMKVSHAKGEIRDNVFEDNRAEGEGGALEIDDDVTYSAGNVFRRNHSGTDGGGLHMSAPFWHIAIDTTTFEDNTAAGCGGGLAIRGKSSGTPPLLSATRLRFTGNQATRGGGFCVEGGALALENAVMAGNVASGAGGGLYVQWADTTLRNAVFHANRGDGSALSFGGVGEAHVSEVSLTENAGTAVRMGASRLTWQYNTHVGARFSGMDDPSGVDGNFDADPRYVDAANGDFRLTTGSPAVDAGDPTRQDPDGTRADVGAYGGPTGNW